MKVIFIRHGKTQGNLEKRYIGQKTDEQIQPEEEKRVFEMRARLQALLSEDIQVFCSPMCRCRRTAEILFEGISPVICPGFAEIDFGFFEGKTCDELLSDARLGETYQEWIDSGGKLPFPGGESRAEFEERNFREFTCVISKTEKSHVDPYVVIVCHGGTIMSILSRLTGRNYYDFMTGNLEGYYLELEAPEGEMHVLSYCRLCERLHA